ncbi:aldehyde dehydrogenase family protein [Planococcus halotolerans]|uniref:aldehyde dehydrogenase family protein n=1 Tax=Planococcus halotolerans TaxID=2233542 RepID=UPI0010929952|nr:aldehyde dehydrogenase family protein [Planococcus halotolerans]QHJ71284.1 aldehyde dehydrogenase family protein [Planococcus halotolerans]
MDKYKDLDHQFINGQWKEGTGTKQIEVVNPYTQEQVTTFKSAGTEDIDEAYRAAYEAQKEWAAVNAFERARIIEEASLIMERRRDELVQLLIEEAGSTFIKANVEVDFCIAITKHSASFPFENESQVPPSIVPGKRNEVLRKPLGVVGVIGPFNFPMYLAMRSVSPALATGNGVVLKPDSQTAITGGTLLGKIFEEAGAPKGILNVVVPDITEIGDAFVEHPIPRMISFTGSTGVGKHIGEIAGRTVKKAVLELGGNNPFVVLKDADIEKAVEGAAFGKYMHSGQICMAVNRIIVHQDIYEEFTNQFLELSKKIKVGDPKDPTTLIGPLINQKAVQRILGEVEQAKSEGAEVLLEGSVEGNVMTPFVLKGTNDMATAKHEMFGPVVTIIPAKDEADALRIANDTQYGLSGSVHSSNYEKAFSFAQRMETGMVHINDQSVNDEPLVAFGGEKNSGLGRFGGHWSLDEFTTFQWISVQEESRQYPFEK